MDYFFSSGNETPGTCFFLVSFIVVAPFVWNPKASVNREAGRTAPILSNSSPGPVASTQWPAGHPYKHQQAALLMARS